ncbi:hypothetical protein OO013_20095 [Mangrovivirga sp. M17]|uniref:Uncharacterized protein n=1 Tax=Mangrovivirga halotolerans TaxID=2993936 RepID=A0ABT3RX82_9BACT|nr:hypothetical protein [Mangrovivirga halotolerans]MCX2746187.1 hypothetical protein [Mangrovivirga halotolerans]
MRLFFISILILFLSTNIFGQNRDRIRSSLDSIALLINELPKSPDIISDSKYEFKYSDDLKSIRIIDLHFVKNSNSKRPDHNVYTFNLSDIDPDAVIIKKSDKNKEFRIKLTTKNNKIGIKQKVYVNGKPGANANQYSMTLGPWTYEYLKDGELITLLFRDAIKESSK